MKKILLLCGVLGACCVNVNSSQQDPDIQTQTRIQEYIQSRIFECGPSYDEMDERLQSCSLEELIEFAFEHQQEAVYREVPDEIEFMYREAMICFLVRNFPSLLETRYREPPYYEEPKYQPNDNDPDGCAIELDVRKRRNNWEIEA
jgi:hypothetical protein